MREQQRQARCTSRRHIALQAAEACWRGLDCDDKCCGINAHALQGKKANIRSSVDHDWIFFAERNAVLEVAAARKYFLVEKFRF